MMKWTKKLGWKNLNIKINLDTVKNYFLKLKFNIFLKGKLGLNLKTKLRRKRKKFFVFEIKISGYIQISNYCKKFSYKKNISLIKIVVHLIKKVILVLYEGFRTPSVHRGRSLTSCTVTCVLLSVSGPEGENQNTFCIINLQIFLANSTQILYTKDRDHTTGGKVGIPTGSMVNVADRLGRP